MRIGKRQTIRRLIRKHISEVVFHIVSFYTTPILCDGSQRNCFPPQHVIVDIEQVSFDNSIVTPCSFSLSLSLYIVHIKCEKIFFTLPFRCFLYTIFAPVLKVFHRHDRRPFFTDNIIFLITQ